MTRILSTVSALFIEEVEIDSNLSLDTNVESNISQLQTIL